MQGPQMPQPSPIQLTACLLKRLHAGFCEETADKAGSLIMRTASLTFKLRQALQALKALAQPRSHESWFLWFSDS